MAQSTINLSGFIRKQFLLRLIFGSVVIFVVAYLLTAPVIIKPMYESEAIVNPPLTLLSQQYQQEGIGFGGNAEIDWYIQVLQSSKMRDSLARRFDLYSRWDINDSASAGRNQMHEILAGRMKVEKNRYGSVSVKLRDHDPLMAAEMTQSMILLGDEIREAILQENRLAAYQLALQLYRAKDHETKKMGESLYNSNNSVNQTTLPGSEAYRQKIIYENELRILAELKTDYERLQKSIETPLPATYILSEPIPSPNPVWPTRLLIALAFALVFGVLYIFFEILGYDRQSSSKEK